LAIIGAKDFELIPAVGLHSPGEKVYLNFGQKPFAFSFETGKLSAHKSDEILIAIIRDLLLASNQLGRNSDAVTAVGTFERSRGIVARMWSIHLRSIQTRFA
jgi:hypothetical protein